MAAPNASFVSILDFKLAFRMLLKHPGLTVTAGLSVAFAVTLTAVSFEFFRDVFSPRLPIDAPDELVEIRIRDPRTMAFEPRILDEFEVWRAELTAVGEVGAFHLFQRTLRTDEGGARALRGASMTAAAFQLARVPPILGRGLLASDETPGAPRVVVLGHDVWRSLFARDPDVVGRTVRLGSESATVVGVMPEGFAFPRQEDVWEPLRFAASDFPPGEGLPVQVVARLAEGSSLAAAQAELAGAGLRDVPGERSANESLRAEVVRYGRVPVPGPDAVSAGIYWGTLLFFALLLALVFGNVALLLFARTAARERELLVRSALGASRVRIVAQLVAEGLVLAGGAAAVGLAAAGAGLELLVGVMKELQGAFFGYWVGGDITLGTAAYTVALTLGGAVVSGVLPALKVTRRGTPSSRRGLSVATSGPEFGRLWSGIIVAQVAATVAFLPLLISFGVETRAFLDYDPGFAAEEYLSARLRTERTPLAGTTPADSRAEQTERYLAAVRGLEARLEAEPGVGAVTLAGQVPGGYHGYLRVAVDGAAAPAASASGHRAQSVVVAPDFFEALRTPVLSGRGLHASDLERSDPVVVVNEDFVRVVLGGRSPLGRTLRYVGARDPDADGPRYEIVGVVKQIAMNTNPNKPASPGIYHPLGGSAGAQLRVIVWTGGDAAAFAPRLQALAAQVAPELQLLDVRPLSEAAWDRKLAHVAVFWLMLATGGMAVLLSTSGIHAILSFSVSRRTREIGVRVALGAGRLQVAAAVLSRTLRQVGLGVAAGGTVAFAILSMVRVGVQEQTAVSAAFVAIFGAYLVAMVCVCLLAAGAPTSRALRVEPTQALNAEG